MEPSRVSQILKEWAAVADQARRPALARPSAAAPGRVVVRGGVSSSTLAGAGLIVGALVVAAVWLGGSGNNSGVGAVPPTTAPTVGPIHTCEAASLHARITRWEGAAGQRIAHVELTRQASDECTISAPAKVQLVDGQGSVLIDGPNPSTTETLIWSSGALWTTLVEDGNYCGPAPVAPVTVAFVLADGSRLVAAPLSPTDVTLPPCNGAGQAADIQMQPWTP